MGWFSISISLLLLLTSILIACTAKDRISPGESLDLRQTITSASNSFSLGFFSLGNNSSHYAGIWYNKLREQTVVWVANRENPLTDSTGALTLMDDGNLAVLDGKNNTLWTSNASLLTGRNSTTAVLMDNGNLVLRTSNQSTVWQSFDTPIGISLSGMKLWLRLKTGQNIGLVSWKDVDDPTPGEFTISIDHNVPRQVVLRGGSEIYWRDNVWQTTTTTMTQVGNNEVSYLTISADDNEATYMLTFPENSIMTMLKLSPTGQLEVQSWDANSEKWIPVWSKDSNKCFVYGLCGPSGSCDFDNPPVVCNCLRGFEPKFQKEWQMGNWSGGCERQKHLECASSDGFYTLNSAKLPDNSISLGNLSAKECELECVSNCSCTAYSYNNLSSWRPWICLIWVGDLFDLVENFPNVLVDLNIRLAASELVENSFSKKKRLLAIVLPLVTIGCLIIGALGYISWNRVNRIEKQGTNQMSNAIELKASNLRKCGDDSTDLPLYTFSSIVEVTNNFSPNNKLGEGGFGAVYKGNLDQGLEIAVKRFSRTSVQGEEEFKTEVQLIAKLQHKNLVRLLGWCLQEEEKLLIYEYLPNNSLDKFLFDPTQSSQLEWNKRFHIVQGIAQGLLYLHHYSRLRVIHRDLKASNILLDASMNPKISDFGLARIFHGNQTEANTNRVIGTFGYMSPEYALDGVFSEKSDIYSFGVLLLEILSGKKNTGFYPSNYSINLLGYAWELWIEDRAMELIDISIGHSIVASEVKNCIHVGLLCVQESPADRPTMPLIVSMLGNETATLPSPKQPAFPTVRCNVHSGPNVSCNCSVNRVTLSMVEPR